jgi:hypothetical protein
LKEKIRQATGEGVECRRLSSSNHALIVSRGVFNELSEAEYSLSHSAQFLCSEHEFSLRAAVLMLTDQTFWQPAAKMDEILQGKPVFNELFGKPFYEYWQHDDTVTEATFFMPVWPLCHP